MAAKKILGDLFTECLRLVDNNPEHVAGQQIINLLQPVLRNAELIGTDSVFPKKGFKVSYERKAGLAILTHRHPESVWSKPHDHGRTWVIYGVLTGRTSMYDYEIVQHKQVKLTNSYWLVPGECRFYATGDIHSHWTHGDSHLIRIEGINMHRTENKVGGKYYEHIA